MFITKNSFTTKAFTILSLVVLMFFIGCKSDEIEINETKTELYLTKYMNYPSHVYPTSNLNDYSYQNWNSDYVQNDSIYIHYDNNKIVKRIGFLVVGNSITGSPTFFTGYIYDTLIYTNNQLTILTKSKSPYIIGVAAYKKVIYFENERIAKTVQSYQYNSRKDITVHYTYSNNLLTKKIGYIGTDLFFQSDLYYNNMSNLDSIVSRKSEYNENKETFEINFSSKNRSLEVFEKYDNIKNQLKPFIIFDETFNRSLSSNNYGKYNYYYFDINGSINNEWHFTYNLKYENELVNYSK